MTRGMELEELRTIQDRTRARIRSCEANIRPSRVLCFPMSDRMGVMRFVSTPPFDDDNCAYGDNTWPTFKVSFAARQEWAAAHWEVLRLAGGLSGGWRSE